MFIQIPFFLTMASADSVLSAAYLFLFVQPLRETNRLNANRQRGMTAINSNTVTVTVVHSPTANKHASARVAPASLYAPDAGATGQELSKAVASVRSPTAATSPTAAGGAPSSSIASAHTMSVALEAVMRRNTKSAAVAILSGICHFAFSTTAMITNEPHMRKLTMPVALVVRHIDIGAVPNSSAACCSCPSSRHFAHSHRSGCVGVVSERATFRTAS